MLELNDREWKPISIASIFTFIRGRENNMAMLENGNIPLISARNINNGLKGFINEPKKIVAGNCITLNNDGDGGAGLSYYQPSDMALDTHVTALIPKAEMSIHAMLFISKCLSKLHAFFGHGLSISNQRVNKIKIMLPVTDEGEPDYAFMEQYIKERQDQMLEKYRKYAEKQLDEIEYKPIKKLEECEWGEFGLSGIDGIFKIVSTSSGIDKNKLDKSSGKIPYITRTNDNNGISGFYCNQSRYNLDSGKCITVGLDTQTAFYQPTPFYTGQNIQLLFNDRLNEYVADFLLTALKKTLSIFNWGSNGATLSRLKRAKILLPVTPPANQITNTWNNIRRIS